MPVAILFALGVAIDRSMRAGDSKYSFREDAGRAIAMRVTDAGLGFEKLTENLAEAATPKTHTKP